MKRPEPIGRALGAAMKGLNLELRMRESRAMALWPDIVGEVTAAKTRPLHVNRGTMVVAVASSAWANQLQLLRPRLLIAIEERVGAGVIRDLRWRTGELDQLAEEAGLPSSRRSAMPGAGLDEPLLTADEASAIIRLAAPIADAGLAEGFTRMLTAHARRRARLRAAGWGPCEGCGAMAEPAAGSETLLCPVCRREQASLPSSP